MAHKMCSVIGCGQRPGPIPVSRLIDSVRVKFAKPAKYYGRLLSTGGIIYVCEEHRKIMRKHVSGWYRYYKWRHVK